MKRSKPSAGALYLRRRTFASIVGPVALVLVLVGSGCVPDYGYVSVTSMPPNYAAYPTHFYAGQPVYYIDGRWYSRGPSGWGYYRREPPDLYRYRQQRFQAPPARRYQAPPAYRRSRAPQRYTAPPARSRDAPSRRFSAPPGPSRRGDRRGNTYTAPPARR